MFNNHKDNTLFYSYFEQTCPLWTVFPFIQSSFPSKPGPPDVKRRSLCVLRPTRMTWWNCLVSKVVLKRKAWDMWFSFCFRHFNMVSYGSMTSCVRIEWISDIQFYALCLQSSTVGDLRWFRMDRKCFSWSFLLPIFLLTTPFEVYMLFGAIPHLSMLWRGSSGRHRIQPVNIPRRSLCPALFLLPGFRRKAFRVSWQSPQPMSTVASGSRFYKRLGSWMNQRQLLFACETKSSRHQCSIN